MNPWQGLKKLPHDMWVIFFTTLINRTGTMVLPFLTLYLTSQRKVSPAEAGFVIAVYGFAALVTAPVVGRISDKIGSLKIMKSSLIFSGLTLILFSFITNYYLILFVTFIWSVINESFRPANMSFISEATDSSQRRTAFALNRLAINLGMSIGPVAGGFLSLIDFTLLFYANAFTAIAAGIYLMFAKINLKRDESASSPTEESEITVSVLKDKLFLFFLIGITPATIVFFQHIGAMPIFVVHDLSYTTAAFGLFSAVNTVLIIIAEVPLNEMMSNWKYKNSLFLGALLCSIGFGGMAFINEGIGLVVTIIIWTVGEMIFFPVTAAYVSEIAPPKKRGEYMGYFQMTFSVGFMLGPWLGTAIYERTGPFYLWIVMFFIGMISTFFMLLIKRELKNS
ncbi:MAG: MFS transporter [Ignavibacteriales bacterium]|nr:MAG: MFS transporter [Ignavibacteriales bacterium]